MEATGSLSRKIMCNKREKGKVSSAGFILAYLNYREIHFAPGSPLGFLICVRVLGSVCKVGKKKT